ncbi:MAG: tetratricopeptide repeat protein [Candidatus Zixiibacteriota bacterium]
MNNEEKNFETLKAEIEKLKKDGYERCIEGVNRSIKHINTIATIIGIVIVVIGVLGGYAMIDATRVKGELREDIKGMKEEIRDITERAEKEIEKVKNEVEEARLSMTETLMEETKKAGELREGIETIKASAEITATEIKSMRKEMLELVDDARTILAETARKKEAAEDAARISQANRYFIEGTILQDARMFDEAIDQFKLAIENDKDFAAAYDYWGITLWLVWERKKERRYLEEALEKIEKATELQKDNYIFWYDKANIHSLLNEKEKALLSLRRAIELNPRYKDMAKTDEIFKWLWDDDDFKKLVE